ncbi:MAG: divalent-cation tolerance protein CutA [Rhodobiaceae bacterium]|nr:divalent-cation tolerance protein CutA [Rhodobiaceae bacterium]
MPQIIEVTVTYDKEETALATARKLVEHRLAACAHVEGPFISVYWWEGKVQQEPEWRLVSKTLLPLKEALIEAIERDHPYELSGILTTQADVSEAFASWVQQEVKA